MNKRYFKYIFPLFLATLFFGIACEKNEQRFDLNEINEPTIETDTNAFRLVQFERLQIPTHIQESQPGGDSYIYEWKAFTNTTATVISTEKDLDVIVDLPPATYDLQYTITNTSTGVKGISLFSLVVNGAFYQGWFVAHNEGNQARLSFIRADGEVFMEPAEVANDIRFTGRAVATHHARFSNNNLSSILYFTTDGVYRFDQNDFSLGGTTSNILPSKGSFTKPAYGLTILGADQYIVDAGGLYAGFGSAFYPEEVLSPFSIRFPGDYDLFPAVIATGQLATYFYDNKYKRFMQVSYLARDITGAPGNPTAKFNMANVGKTMIAADMGRASFSSGIFYFVMEDEEGRYFYSLNNTNPVHNQKMEVALNPDIDQATAFATSSLYEHMYYVAGNKIYHYNMVGNAAQLAYEFPAGVVISDIKIQRNTNRTLAVAVKNGPAGEVYLFDINELGRFADETYRARFAGFGEIAHLAFRQ